jgi:Undecaprenyl-phosphate glucose phosphotransferase
MFAAPFSDEIKQRQGLSPALISEVQIVILPLGVVLAAIVAKLFYFGLLPRSFAPFSFYIGAGVFAAIVMALISSQTGVHSTLAIVAGKRQLRLIVTTISLSFLIMLGLFYLLKISDQFSRGWLALWYALSIIFLNLERLGILLWARLLRAECRLLQRVAVFGNVELSQRVIERVFAKDRNLVLTGIFSNDSPSQTGKFPVTGNMDALIAAVQSGLCDRIIVAFPRGAHESILETIASLEMLPIDVQLSPDAMTVPYPIQGAQEAGGLVLLDLQKRPLSARGQLVKITIDYLTATVALILLLPAMLAIALAIKIDSRGPVFFIQSRHGYNHRVIRVIKFRSMTVAEDGPVVTQAVRGDKRVTRVGRFLRRTSLDELPQLINVMRGELSLVGPRPHAVIHNQSYAEILSNYATRHKVKPGITGWAQVNGCRGETKTPEDMRKRVELDLYYIKNWSAWFDLQILARTLLVPFNSNAY